jgi:hypothetical protein
MAGNNNVKTTPKDRATLSPSPEVEYHSGELSPLPADAMKDETRDTTQDPPDYAALAEHYRKLVHDYADTYFTAAEATAERFELLGATIGTYYTWNFVPKTDKRGAGFRYEMSQHYTDLKDETEAVEQLWRKTHTENRGFNLKLTETSADDSSYGNLTNVEKLSRAAATTLQAAKFRAQEKLELHVKKASALLKAKREEGKLAERHRVQKEREKRTAAKEAKLKARREAREKKKPDAVSAKPLRKRK